MTRSTLILTQHEIEAALPISDYIEAMELAFLRHAQGAMLVPEVVEIHGAEGSFHVKSAAFAVSPYYVAVKINGNFPGNPHRRGLPTIQGAILLSDGVDGFPLAILDSAEVTAKRTAAATAVAARRLAKPDATTATILGCGVQGRIHLDALRRVLQLREVFVHDADGERSAAFAAEVAEEPGVSVEAVEDFREATARSQVVVTCTTSDRAFLEPEHVRPGVFIAGVGADNPQKSEISPRLMGRARVVADLLEQCAAIGDLRHAIEAGAMTKEDVHAELGEILLGAKPGRQSPEEIFVFDSTGTAIQDVAAAGRIYERARERQSGLHVRLSRELHRAVEGR